MTDGESSAGEQAASITSPAIRKLVDNPWVLLGLLFLVTAALGIPVLWVSRAFSTPVKILLTIVVSVYTILILWLFWIVMAWCWPSVVEVLQLLREWFEF